MQGVTQNVNIWLHAFFARRKKIRIFHDITGEIIFKSSLMDVVQGERKRNLPTTISLYEICIDNVIAT